MTYLEAMVQVVQGEWVSLAEYAMPEDDPEVGPEAEVPGTGFRTVVFRGDNGRIWSKSGAFTYDNYAVAPDEQAKSTWVVVPKPA